MAVKITCWPSQIVVVSASMITLTGASGVTDITMTFDIAGFGLAHEYEEVTSHSMMSLSVRPETI